MEVSCCENGCRSCNLNGIERLKTMSFIWPYMRLSNFLIWNLQIYKDFHQISLIFPHFFKKFHLFFFVLKDSVKLVFSPFLKLGTVSNCQKKKGNPPVGPSWWFSFASLQVGEASDHSEDSDFEVAPEGGTCCAHFGAMKKGSLVVVSLGYTPPQIWHGKWWFPIGVSPFPGTSFQVTCWISAVYMGWHPTQFCGDYNKQLL